MSAIHSHTVNHQVRLASRPQGLPTAANWQFTEAPVAEPEAGGLLVKVLAISLDPAMRGWMNEGKSYIPPVAIGAVMRAGGVGVVVASKHPGYAVGDYVAGGTDVQEYWSVPAEQVQRSGLTKIDLRLGTLTQWLNVLGMPGMTGYFGLMDVGQPKAGETLVVSGAAGAVGQTVGQLAKLKGCRVVGIAGGPAKCDWVVDELGFDACIDYKQPAPAGAPKWDAVREGLKQHCPDGVDIYFDNVGGDILDTVLTRIKRKARIVICGAISQYNATTAVQGPKNYLSLLVNRARMEGIVVFDYAARYPQAIAEMAAYLKDGRMKSKEDVVTGGVQAFPATLNRLFSGENFGKLVLQVAPS
ncbi:MAG: NADP-dependent oxidoreductase [Rubrivivax sp.]|nr:NADP-dependent oxidoreductase [Rubrivivax sp.]